MTSSSAFSSPKRYSSGPATMPIERSPTSPACSISVTAASDTLALRAEARLQRDEHLGGVECQRRDRQTLDDLIRVRAEDCPVFERGRLAFGSIAHGVPVPAGAAPYRAPFVASGNPRRRGRADRRAPTPRSSLPVRAPSLGETFAAADREPLLERLHGLVRQNDLDAAHGAIHPNHREPPSAARRSRACRSSERQRGVVTDHRDDAERLSLTGTCHQRDGERDGDRVAVLV